MKEKAFAYLRVSGRGQIDGHGFQRQRDKIAAFASKNGYDIAGVFEENGVSGTSELSERPALSDLMLKIAGNGVRTVIVERADRLARNLIAYELLIEEFQRMGARVIDAESGNDISSSDSNDPTSIVIRQILAAISEFDKNSTVLKLRMARKRTKALKGRCEGRKPYGSEEGEAEVIELIKSLRRKRNGKRMSFAKIAEELERKGVKTRDGHGKWYPATVRRIISRKVPVLSEG